MLFLDQPVSIRALTQLYLATSPEIEEKNIHSEYFVSIAKRSMDKMNPLALNVDLGEELWDYSQRVTDER